MLPVAGLLAHWPLDAQSSLSDVSGNGFHLAASFSPVTYREGPQGQPDGATVFQAPDIPTSSQDMANVTDPLTSFTVTAWVYHLTQDSDGYPFFMVDNGGTSLFRIKTSSTKLAFFGTVLDSASVSLAAKQWFHLAVIYDASSDQLSFHVDGQRLSSKGSAQQVSTSWIQGNGAMVILGQVKVNTAATAYQAALSDVKFYGGVLPDVYPKPPTKPVSESATSPVPEVETSPIVPENTGNRNSLVFILLMFIFNIIIIIIII